ncbi:DUF4097 domain-containing protein [Bacillus sp. HMF5848]|uniref:DUF4097 family beta strand repeat-containing protein n=1 Tax=Bacillus sp. HMF5848 TaxID=2495421 RepID=UPI000F77E211|nr:DUF4097 domain-containing protein [Bacillus sp. HMF5848]RSK28576.1 DUF4097 domain-containing protein [Bacillus sp. HMF5848]
MGSEKKRILKLVEEGKLSAEEAITLLEALDSNNDHKKSDEFTFNNYKYASLKDKVFDFLDTAIQKVKEIDVDFNFASTTSVDHVFQQDLTEPLTQMQIELANGSVQLKPWAESGVRIECNAKVFGTDSHDEANRLLMQDTAFTVDSGMLKFTALRKTMRLDTVVYIPENEYEHVKVKVFNGTINGERMKVKEYKMKTANGAITLLDSEADRLSLETGNGQVKVKDSKVRDCEVETVNGAISVTGNYEKVDLQTFNGHITFEPADESCKNVVLKTTTGSIDYRVAADVAIQGELRSSLGSFTCNIPGLDVVEEKNDVMQKSMRFRVNKDVENPMYFYAETKTGSITLKKLS